MAVLRTESTFQSYFNLRTLPFWAIHLGAIAGVVALGLSWTGVLLALASYVIRMLFVMAGYHRYFSHRTFATSRWFQFVLAIASQSGAQRGVLWWAVRHREHHRHADQEQDLHSPVRMGFFWSHMGWMLSSRYDETDLRKVSDLAKFPELRVLNALPHLPVVALALGFYLLGGVHALVWGFLVSTLMVLHGTFTINSLSHLYGKRRYRSSDTSRNNWVLAALTMGEGWHNNHHYYQSSANQGFFWWEFDLTMLFLRLLERVGLIWNLRRAPHHVVEGRRRRGHPVTELVGVDQSEVLTQL